MLGRLSWAAIPFDVPVVMIAAGSVGFVIFCVLALVTVKGWWPYLWREWITSVDHKRIGVMYIGLAFLMLVRGFSDAMMMRSQLALAAGHAQGYLPPEHYDQIFSAHGTIMIFFVAMPFVVGLMNFVLPLQLGVRDVAFPRDAAHAALFEHALAAAHARRPRGRSIDSLRHRIDRRAARREHSPARI